MFDRDDEAFRDKVRYRAEEKRIDDDDDELILTPFFFSLSLLSPSFGLDILQSTKARGLCPRKRK